MNEGRGEAGKVKSELRRQLGSRRTATTLVHEWVRSAIIEGELEPEERLIEAELADRLQISRTPLRHAVMRLESEGWLTRSTTGGLHVAGVSEQELDALYAVRSALESLSVEEVGARITDSEIGSLRSILDEQGKGVEAGDFARVNAAGARFHELLWSLSKNRICIEFLNIVYARTKRYRHLGFDDETLAREGLQEHREILELLAENNMEQARQSVITHIEHSREAARAAFRKWCRGSM